MPQINLLKQNSTPDYSWVKVIVSLGIKLLIVAIIAGIGFYGWLYKKAGDRKKQIIQLNAEVLSAKKSIENSKEKEEIFFRQAQIKEQEKLIANHVYWSHIFPVLASSTLEVADYTHLLVSDDGVVGLSITLPDMVTLEKYLQVFDLPAYNKYFSNVRISSINKTQAADGLLKIKVDTKMEFDPSILKFSFNAATSTASTRK